jgi:hypothetical protein
METNYMIKNEVIILERVDLTIHNNKEFSEIEYCDFRMSREKFCKASVVLFVDSDNRTKILKNRYGF